MSTKFYSALAEFYDAFTENVDYSRRAEFLAPKLELFGSRQTILDAGCGTGTLSAELLKRGFDVIGVDISPEMLMVAREKNPEQLLLCQDLQNLDLYGTVQGAVCMQDTLNHLPDINAVRAVIARIALFMESGSIFVFDINSEYKHRSVLNNNNFVYESEDGFCVWQNELNEADGSVNMFLDIFSRKSGNTYSRATEEIREIIIDEEMLAAILAEIGLEVLEILDGESYEQRTPTSQRILYITRKK